jgi:hypothetical protein
MEAEAGELIFVSCESESCGRLLCVVIGVFFRLRIMVILGNFRSNWSYLLYLPWNVNGTYFFQVLYVDWYGT